MGNRTEAARALAGALALLAGASPSLAGPAELVELLAGEYDNNEQVWQQGVDGEPPGPRRHWLFRRHGPSGLQLAVGRGQAAPDPPTWTLRFSEGAGGIFSEVLGAATCRYRWRERDGGYEGSAAALCPGLPAELRVDREWLTARWLTESGDGVERARRVGHYTGWVALQRQRIDPSAVPDDYVFLRSARWHDEGFVLPVLDGDRPTGYAIELARLTYQNTRTAVLKLGVVDLATGETLAYSWAEPGASRIGINLRWIQAGLTREGSGAAR
ncbi:MAG: hypothetical protein OXH08_11000 [Gammaproteobacteria bacterium]|nr:hypothetical protein [Gammaproteobacteria bacterium]